MLSALTCASKARTRRPQSLPPFRKAREADRKVRMNGTIEPPVEAAHARSTPAADENFFVRCNAQMLKSSRLNRGERATLRSLIQGPVAAMTAEHFSGLLDTGLENNDHYKDAIAGLKNRVLAPGTRIADLLAFLDTAIRLRVMTGEEGATRSPTAVKVLLAEAVARQLGKDWTSDRASFIDVSIAASRLQELAQALTREASVKAGRWRAPLAAIVLPRGEQHSLMCYLTGALFQTLGWQQQVVPHESFDQPKIAEMIARADVVCVGWSNMRLKSDVQKLIADIKLNTQEKAPPVIAGGVAALDFVDFLVGMGTNCVCDSAYSAVKISENYYNLGKTSHFPAPMGDNADKKTSRIDRQSQ